MPPKIVDLNTFIGKSDNAVFTFKELFEEFEEINSVEPRLGRLESTFKIGEGIKNEHLNVAKTFAACQKHISQPTSPTVNQFVRSDDATKMAQAMEGPKSVANNLERLPVPDWDRSRK